MSSAWKGKGGTPAGSSLAEKPNYVLQRTPGTSYVSTHLRGPAPLNTALDLSMYTNGFVSEVPHAHASVIAALGSFRGACGFRLVSAGEGSFLFKRHWLLPDRIELTVEPATSAGRTGTKVVVMLAPDPIRNWFFLERPTRTVSAFRAALSEHLASILRLGASPGGAEV